MRWLFIGMVALNAIYFTWAYGTHGESQAAPELSKGGGQSFPRTLEMLTSTTKDLAPQVGGPPLAAGCPAIGPFAEASSAREVLALLSAAGREAEEVVSDGQPTPYYWVYLPPFEGRQQALRKLRELQAAGIDSFIVAEGADGNAISLGSFAGRDSALGLQARLRMAGHPAQIREQIKSVSQEWVVLTDPMAQGFIELIPPRLLAGARLERRPCRPN